MVTLARARKLFRQFRGSIGGNFVNPVTKFECEVSLFTLNNPNARFRNALSAAVGGKRQDYVRVCGWKTSAVTLKIEVCFFSFMHFTRKCNAQKLGKLFRKKSPVSNKVLSESWRIGFQFIITLRSVRKKVSSDIILWNLESD